jgi:aminoglycoside phosphotransferase (APT) family kinase protein
MPSSPELPPPAAALLASAFPGAPITGLAPAVGGFSNLSLLATIGGARCAVKAAHVPTKRADLAREARVLALLAGRGVRAPALLAHAEGDGWSVLVTRRRPGTPGLRLYAQPPQTLEAPLRALGAALGRLHRLDLPPPADAGDAGLLAARRAQALAGDLDALPVPSTLREQLAAALRHPAWRPASARLTHGDAGLHNILWGQRTFTLLDWELAGWGDSRLDLAWAAWTLRFRGLPPACWEALLAGYRANGGPAELDEEAARALALGQVAGLLARSAGGGAWGEWLRRAEWSLALGRLLPDP